jgi:Mn-dependent DtxR family transcriptional regulator
LEETEKIEHNISEETLKRLEVLVRFMENDHQWVKSLHEFGLQSQNHP